MRIALTIAGSDSISGAGIQADLKTFSAFGLYAATVVTAITAQNTTGVSDVFPLPGQMVRSQIDQITRDVQLSTIKTGMLATAEIVSAVADAVSQASRVPLVVDPVIAAAVGNRTLLASDAVSILKTRLLPLTSVVTPNVDEAAKLSGVAVDSLGSAREAAKRILELGPTAVVIKGGHMRGPHAVDLLLYSGTFTEFAAPRSAIGRVHGTGCTFASALAAGLALGDDIPAAVDRAKKYITGAIEQSVEIGHGSRVVNHFWRGLY